MRPVIRARGLSVVYPTHRGLLEVLRHPLKRPQGVEALRAVDLDARPGEVLGLLGPNGAGKTTLLKVLADLVRPCAGSVEVAGHDLSTEPRAVRASVGWIPSEDRTFFFRLSGRENLRFFAALDGLDPGEADARIDEELERFGLADQADRRFGLYSTGRRKLFTVIRGLLPDPPVLILDEPTNGLDPFAGAALQEHVKEELARRRGRTVVWATHRLEEVAKLCDHVVLMHGGGVRFHGHKEEFAALAASGGEGRSELEEAFALLTREGEA